MRHWFRAQYPYSLLLAVDAVICLVILVRVTRKIHPLAYIQLLPTYDFGLLRRALLGEIVSWFTDTVPSSLTYQFGLPIWVLALGLYLLAFHRAVGLTSPGAAALLCFTAGSPFFFKNFMYALGYLDVFGCVVAIVALLLPIRIASTLLLGVLTAGLLLLHHLHALLYVPTIGAIWAVRSWGFRKPTLTEIAACAAVSIALLGLSATLMFYATLPVPPAEFAAAISRRARDPVDLAFVHVWHTGLGEEIAQTWRRLPKNLPFVPLFLVCLALHAPAVRAFANAMSRLPRQGLILAMVSLAAITAAYLVICVVAFDYGRWFSSWFVCMALMFLAVHLTAPAASVAIDPQDRRTRWLALAVTAIPRIGIYPILAL